MKYFLDTEFIEYPCTIDLISIGIVAEDGREFYMINKDCNWNKASDWVKENVLQKLPKVRSEIKPLPPGARGILVENFYPVEYQSKYVIAQEILNFIGTDKPSFWGYYADYDWVVFCWLFGKMTNLPKGWPMYCRDFKQYLDSIGNPPLPKNENDNHNALEDARHLKKCFDMYSI